MNPDIETAWILAVSPRIGELVDLARSVARSVTVVAAGSDGSAMLGADRVIAVPGSPGQPAEVLAPVVAGAVTAGDGDLVLAADRPAERVLAGAVAARLGAPFVGGLLSVARGEAQAARFGGISVETVGFSGPVVAVLHATTQAAGAPSPVETVTSAGYVATVTGTAPSQSQPVNLSAARRIVGCGRGFKAEVDLALARDLAGELGAEIGCSRPLAEGQGWLAKDRYIGVSGERVGPDLYVAVGISGQLQHMTGVQGAKAIVAINSDAAAPIFAQTDYGIVGDLYDVLPALTAALHEDARHG